MRRATKELLCRDPGIALETLIERLEQRGYEAAWLTIQSIRDDFRDTIRVAQECGYIRVLDTE